MLYHSNTTSRQNYKFIESLIYEFSYIIENVISLDFIMYIIILILLHLLHFS